MAAEKMTLLVKKDDGKKPKPKGDKNLPTQYGKYSGIVKDGKSIDNPKESEAISTMASYMRKNNPESNVYRPEFSHTGIVYDKNKKQKDA